MRIEKIFVSFYRYELKSLNLRFVIGHVNFL